MYVDAVASTQVKDRAAADKSVGRKEGAEEETLTVSRVPPLLRTTEGVNRKVNTLLS